MHIFTRCHIRQTLGNAGGLENHFFNVALALGVLAGSKPETISGVVRMMPIRIVIMAKAPVAGFAKTRLIPALGAEGAAQLALKMLRHTLATALASKLGVVEICATPAPSDPAWQNLDLPSNIIWSAQAEGDLGDRMAHASARTTRGGEAVLLIGTDCPAIDVFTLHDAAQALYDYDASLLPTYDGGYALLALKRFDHSLFGNMTWSTSTVAFQTLQRMVHIKYEVKVLQTLHDIDEPMDLVQLPMDWGYVNGHQ
jgi:rSAM/selenodomain-associated transferase 1